ncbi:meiosis specific cyclin Crs1 [Schizosaccharomyces cryophilus OY26]|uniref:Meiosis specific cyclin Crs1 n=1 Tax=Schizosaccharomyces cryophilus (strain OY26 / ATCC MYA-4695 / CBS 11777 / NBRC 106824 / NRRL Y48691) TaxID=653667 RepID=S9VW73_SCHCR|nr:meiosis specific cyclin Crs1 [Schizosaccharomyces cryophilus OY26]EPY50484.1 meiosis specific cyclin Crs1 [Schizosaccharomyces cryophilus OY26]
MDTLCIAIVLLDRCYSIKPSIPSKAFKIYAIGTLFIACKLTSDFTVAKKSFCKQLAPSLSIRELEKYEKIVLSLLTYDIYVLSLPSVESYLTPLIFQHSFFKTLSEEDSEQLMCEWQYMLVEIMKDCRFTAFRPSEIICASLWILLNAMWPSRFVITPFFYLCTSMDIEGDKENEFKYLKRFNDCIELIFKKLPSLS